MPDAVCAICKRVEGYHSKSYFGIYDHDFTPQMPDVEFPPPYGFRGEDPDAPSPEEFYGLEPGEPIPAQMPDVGIDNLHHAPACPANHYHGMRKVTGSCTCGANREMYHTDPEFSARSHEKAKKQYTENFQMPDVGEGRMKPEEKPWEQFDASCMNVNYAGEAVIRIPWGDDYEFIGPMPPELADQIISDHKDAEAKAELAAEMRQRKDFIGAVEGMGEDSAMDACVWFKARYDALTPSEAT